MKQRIIIAALISLCYTLVIEGKPQLYSCNLKVLKFKVYGEEAEGSVMK